MIKRNVTIHLLCMLLLLSGYRAFAAEGDAAPTEATAEQAATEGTEPPSQPVTETEPLQPRSEPDADFNRMQDLANSAQPETEVVWLETESDRIPALYHSQSSREDLGGIIIFPETGTHADWPGTVGLLRQTLSDRGWHTLAVQLPEPPAAVVPKRTLPSFHVIARRPPAEPATDTAEQAEQPAPPADTEAASTETPAEATPAPQPSAEAPGSPSPSPEEPAIQQLPYGERLQALGLKALEAIRQRNEGPVVVLGVGSGAAWAAKFVSETQALEPRMGLVMLDVASPNTPDAPVLAEVIKTLKVPVVDIYQGPPNSHTGFEDDARQRKRWALRYKLANYYQRRLGNSQLSWAHQSRWLPQQVAGLLKLHILEKMAAPEQTNETNGNRKARELPPGQSRPQPI